MACAVDPALVRAACYCVVQEGQTAQTPALTTSSTACTHWWRWRPTSVWWWDHDQCRGSRVRQGLAPVPGQRDQEGEDMGAKGGSLGTTETWEKEEEKRQKDGIGMARTWVEKKEEAQKRAREQ